MDPLILAGLPLLPVALVVATYVESDPSALSDHVINRLGLTGSAAALFRDVLTGAGQNQRADAPGLRAREELAHTRPVVRKIGYSSLMSSTGVR